MVKKKAVKKILFLAANPRNSQPLRLDEEVREISERLQRSRHRDKFTLSSRWAVRPKDLRQSLLDVEPLIVHFSGHGTKQGQIILENNAGNSHTVEPSALAAIFELFGDKIECVILNACFSKLQANAIRRHVNYVVGMKKEIGDKAAIEFTTGFYDALGAGRTIEEAFKFGCNALQLEGISEHLTPVLLKRKEKNSLNQDKQSGVKRMKYYMVLTGSFDEENKKRIETIAKHLRQLSGDTSITIEEILPGSVHLVIKGTADGFEKIKELYLRGDLKSLEGLIIEGVSAPIYLKSYFQIFFRLVVFFEHRGVNNSQELADETIDRVIGQRRKKGESLDLTNLAYAYGVAKKVYLEYLRARKNEVLPDPEPSIESQEFSSECLDKCLSALPGEQRILILDYFSEVKLAKIERHRELAKKLAITQTALRMKVVRIKQKLKKCLVECMNSAETNEL